MIPKSYLRVLNHYLKVPLINGKEMREKVLAQRDECFEWIYENLKDSYSSKGNITDVPESFRMFNEQDVWQAIRKCVMYRDDFSCQICDEMGTEVHHIRPRYMGGKNHPHNLMTVCHDCHVKIHNDLEKSIEYAIVRSIDREIIRM